MRGAHSKHHFRLRHTELFGYYFNRRLGAVLCGVALYEFAYFLGGGFDLARNFNTAVVAHKPLYFPRNHRHGIGGKSYAVTFVEAVNRL